MSTKRSINGPLSNQNDRCTQIAERRHGGSGLDAQLAPLRAVFVGGIHGGLAPWEAKMEIMAMIGSILWQYGNNIYGNIYIEHGSI
jgi:hypothetical protein